jgi:LacI family transcriptional regulator
VLRTHSANTTDNSQRAIDKDKPVPKRERFGKQTGRKYVTQKDVAERAGVSSSIVSYVINNGPRSISEETRQRVLHAIAELGYRPNEHAQKLMRASWDSELAPRQFGVIVSGFHRILRRPYFPTVLFGILDKAAKHNLSMRFIMFIEELDDPLLFNKLIHPEEISSIILITAGPLLVSKQGLARIERIRARIPNLVSIGQTLPDIPTIMYDMSMAFHQSTGYLLGLGHRRIAYIGTHELRLPGYQQALADYNLDFDPGLVFEIASANTSGNGYETAQVLIDSGVLQGPSPVTAIVAGSDEAAWGIMRRLHEVGLRIPADISLIGFDNQDVSTYTIPALTTINLPQVQSGVLAVQALLEGMDSTSGPAASTMLPTELVIRESCSARN